MKTTRWLAALLCLAVMAVARETALMPLPQPPLLATLTISPDGDHVAYIEQTDVGQVVRLDGQPGPAFAHIRAPWMMYDPDIDAESLHVAQHARHSGIFFSPDGRHVAYVIGEWTDPEPVLWRKARVAVVLDGTPGPLYDEVTFPQFSDDGRHLAYTARMGEQWMVVIDGKHSEPFDQLEMRVSRSYPRIPYDFFGPGGRYAYAGKLNDRWHVVLDGVRRPAYPRVSDLTFSADGLHFAYAVHEIGRGFVVVDGVRKPVYQAVDGLTFSPDGKRLGYRAQLPARRQTWVMVVGGVEGKPYPGVFPPVFSPDGKHVAYRAFESTLREFVVVDGRETSRYQRISEPSIAFTPDNRLYFEGNQLDGTKVLIIDGRVYRHAYQPVFSDDGRRLAYVLIDKRYYTLVLDGTPQPQPENWWISPQTFTPDGRHLVSIMSNRGWANPGDPQDMRVVVDDRPGPLYDYLLAGMHTIIGGAQVYLDAPDRFHYFAVRDGTLYRVDEIIAP